MQWRKNHRYSWCFITNFDGIFQVVSASDAVLSTVFNIPRPATVSSGTAEHKVTITILDLEPIMFHETVPSKDKNVYVSASAINTSLFPLLAGQASVYVGNSFVAKVSLNFFIFCLIFSCFHLVC